MTTIQIPGQCQIQVTYDDGVNTIDLTPLITQVTWSGDITQAARKLVVEIRNTIDGRTQAVNIQVGGELIFYDYGTEMFRGIVFEHQIKKDGTHAITAFDMVYYFTKSTDTRKISNMTASQLLILLCEQFEIPYGYIADTKYVIPGQIIRNKSLWETLSAALLRTREQTGKRFNIISKNGKVELWEGAYQTTSYILENGVNIFDGSYSQSIEDLITVVQVTDSSKTSPMTYVVRNQNLIDAYGIMQHNEDTSGKSQSEMIQLANNLLNDLGTINDKGTVDTFGVNTAIAGSNIYVYDAMMDMSGGMYIITDSHTYENGEHKMELTLSSSLDIPKLNYKLDKLEYRAIQAALSKTTVKTHKTTVKRKKK